MSVEAAPANHIATWARQRYITAPGQQWAGQQDRCANLAREGCVRFDRSNVAGFECPAMAGTLLDADAELLEQADFGCDIADPRHILEHNLVVGEQGSREHGQGCVLIAGRRDRTIKTAPTLDNEAFHEAS